MLTRKEKVRDNYNAAESALEQLRVVSSGLCNAAIHLQAMGFNESAEDRFIATPLADLIGGCQQIVDSVTCLLIDMEDQSCRTSSSNS